MLWGPYQDFRQLVRDDPQCSPANPMFGDRRAARRRPVDGEHAAAGVCRTAARVPPSGAPRLGEHTEAVLTEILGLPSAEYARLHDAGVVAGPSHP